MGPKLYNAVRLYVDGVRDGHLSSALDKYVSDDLVQHTPGVRAGRAGLAAIFQPLIDRHQRRSVLPMRGFEDGSRVFLHTFATFGARVIERIGIDVFDTNGDDQIVEHWSASAPLSWPAASGASAIDGPRIATDPELTAVNTRLVRTYLDGDARVGRSPACQGRRDPGAMIEHGHGEPEYAQVDQVLGHGSLVAAIGARADHGYAADLFRVEGGRIAEHWDVRHQPCLS